MDNNLYDISRRAFDRRLIPELFEGWRMRDDNHYLLTEETSLTFQEDRYRVTTPFGECWFVYPRDFGLFFEQFEMLGEVEVYFRVRKTPPE